MSRRRIGHLDKGQIPRKTKSIQDRGEGGTSGFMGLYKDDIALRGFTLNLDLTVPVFIGRPVQEEKEKECAF